MKKKLIGALIIIFALTMTLIGCKENKFVLVEPSNIEYSGTTLTWDKVEAADSYLIKINDEAEQKREQNSFAYSAKKADFAATIVAVRGKRKKSTTQEFRYIPGVSAVKTDSNGVISWDATEGATAYKLKVNGKVLENDITECTYNLLPDGNNVVQILPIVVGDKGVYSDWSSAKTINILAAPGNIKYDGEVLSWTATLGVTKYLVYINGTEVETNENNLTYNANSNNFNFQIKAIGNNITNFDSKLSETQTFTYLPTATNIQVKDGILVWDEVIGAENYQIRINGITKNEVLKLNKYENLISNSSEEISIKPLGKVGFSFSNWSAPKVVYLLKSPEVKWNPTLESSTTENANNVLWDTINNAEGYDVKVRFAGIDKITQLSKTSKSFGSAFAEVGEYELSVKAKAGIGTTETNTYDSKYSNPIKITRLSMPNRTKEQFIVSDAGNVQKGFTITYSTVDNASGYHLYKDKAPVDGAFATTNQMNINGIIAKEITAEQKISYAIKSIGKIKSGQIIILDSLEMLEAPITVLAMPTNTRMEGYNLKWNSVDKANNYTVNVGAKPIIENALESSLSKLESGIFDVSVCARGNGQNILPSNYTADIKVERLNSPTNIKFDTLGTGKLGWDSVLNALSYTAYLDTNKTGFNSEMTAEFNDINKHISTNGTTLTMETIANYYNANNTIYYMTSPHSKTMQITKLMTPTFPDKAYTYSSFRWLAPANINVGEYTPTYQVQNDKNMSLNGELSGTSMNITSLTAGRHSLSVRGIGDGRKFINSDWTELQSITKLETPTIQKQNNQYIWAPISGAVEYMVTVDGKKTLNKPNIVNTQVSYDPLFERAKTYIVEVIAVGDDGLTTINSNPAKIEQIVKTLDIPQITLSYNMTEFDVSGILTVTISNPISNCNGYKFNISGTTHITDNLVYSFSPQTANAIDVFVIAQGGTLINDIYYIDSLPSPNKSILLLKAPSEIKYYEDGRLTFSGINDSIGYEYYIAYDGNDYNMTLPCKVANVTELTPSETATAKHSNFKIKIRAKGNGSTIITSQWIEFRQERL